MDHKGCQRAAVAICRQNGDVVYINSEAAAAAWVNRIGEEPRNELRQRQEVVAAALEAHQCCVKLAGVPSLRLHLIRKLSKCLQIRAHVLK